MSTRIREGLSFITTAIGNNNFLPPFQFKVGKVYAVILGPTSVPEKVWNDNGNWAGIGTILYQVYDESTEVPLDQLNDATLSTLPTALPLYPNQKYFPLPGEIVLLMDLPSAPSPITNKTEETYYVSVINAWNSPQFNGLFINEDKSLLYNSFTENSDFRGVQTFEGDYVLEGRFGNSLRFGSTNRSGDKDLTPWSTNPGELNSNPILILSNEHGFKPSGSDLYVENINQDGSSFYLTSQQIIPLNIGNVRLSNITEPIGISSYSNPQAIINADRTIISSKSDEVLVFGRTGVELYSQGPVYMQSDKTGITIQDNIIALGPSIDTSFNKLQPVVLGNNLRQLLSGLYKALSDFSTDIIDAKATPEGITIMDIALAAEKLQTYLSNNTKKLNKDNLLSKTVKTL
jgi:hypothetical protein